MSMRFRLRIHTTREDDFSLELDARSEMAAIKQAKILLEYPVEESCLRLIATSKTVTIPVCRRIEEDVD